MENDTIKEYRGIIKILRTVSDIILAVGVLAAIVTVLLGLSGEIAQILTNIAIAIGYLIVAFFVYSLGRTLAIIAEIKVNNYKSKQD